MFSKFDNVIPKVADTRGSSN